MRAVSLCLSAALLASAACATQGTAPELEADPEVVELFTNWTLGGEARALDKVIAAHQALYPNTLILSDGGGDPLTRAADLMRAGTPPELIQNKLSPGEIDRWLAIGSGLQDLDAIYARSGWSAQLHPFLMSNVIAQGHHYAVPVSMSRENNLIYNKRVLADHGLSPPTSMAELPSICATLKAANVDCVGASFQDWMLEVMFHSVAMMSGGGAFFRDLYTKASLDGPKLQQAVDDYHNILTNYVDDIDWDEVTRKLHDNEVAFSFQGDWAVGHLNLLGSQSGVDYDVLAIPGATDIAIYSIEGFTFPVEGFNTSGAARFVSTFLQSEVQRVFSLEKGSCPAVQGVDLGGFSPVVRSVCTRGSWSRMSMPMTSTSTSTQARSTGPTTTSTSCGPACKAREWRCC